jgi:hypothetical protein
LTSPGAGQVLLAHWSTMVLLDPTGVRAHL